MQKSAKTTGSSENAVIFDFGGLVFNDLLSTWNISNDVFVHCQKKPIGLEEFRENFELPYFQIFLKYGLSKEDAKATSLRIFHENYGLYKDLRKPFDAAKPCIESLSKAGYLLGIVSQTPREMLDYELEGMGLKWMIPNSIAKGEVPEEKPLPLPLFEMMERLGVSRHQAIYVGDTFQDIQCAYFAGVTSVAVANEWSYNTFEKLYDAKPDYIISDLSELEQILVPEIEAKM